jgi:hypothetical protein
MPAKSYMKKHNRFDVLEDTEEHIISDKKARKKLREIAALKSKPTPLTAEEIEKVRQEKYWNSFIREETESERKQREKREKLIKEEKQRRQMEIEFDAEIEKRASVESAFRFMSLKYHPDKGGNNHLQIMLATIKDNVTSKIHNQ